MLKPFIKHILLAPVAVLTALSLTLVSCKDEKKDKVFFPPSIDAETLSIPSEGMSEGMFVYVSVAQDLEWSIEITYPAETAEWGSLNPRTGIGSASPIFVCGANDSEESRSVTLQLKTADGSSSVTLSQFGKGEVTPSKRKGTPTAAPKWLELPATSADDGLDFYHHPMTIMVSGRAKRTRNYSYYFDYGARVAIWVAYPLNTGLIGGTGKRSEAWGLDPLMPKDDQAVLYSGFGVYGIDRGHQIPSADRYNLAANMETFYGTNMTPQNHAFNSGVWARLEDKVRAWARASDTLYVVTGCIIDPPGGKVTDNVGKSVTKPSAYYKAVLRLSSSGTLGHGGYNACAVWLDHDESLADMAISKSMSLSVRALEEKTGIDFFVNLPDKVGAATAKIIEEENPKSISWWW
ncbi:MAG: DNA/RNA non-specific endonuclease [Bacteroidales bacterium]|nr:DNA/RNA non-specific endonuclease [Bacteroidales bacterium]